MGILHQNFLSTHAAKVVDNENHSAKPAYNLNVRAKILRLEDVESRKGVYSWWAYPIAGPELAMIAPNRLNLLSLQGRQVSRVEFTHSPGWTDERRIASKKQSIFADQADHFFDGSTRRRVGSTVWAPGPIAAAGGNVKINAWIGAAILSAAHIGVGPN